MRSVILTETYIDGCDGPQIDIFENEEAAYKHFVERLNLVTGDEWENFVYNEEYEGDKVNINYYVKIIKTEKDGDVQAILVGGIDHSYAVQKELFRLGYRWGKQQKATLNYTYMTIFFKDDIIFTNNPIGEFKVVTLEDLQDLNSRQKVVKAYLYKNDETNEILDYYFSKEYVYSVDGSLIGKKTNAHFGEGSFTRLDNCFIEVDK